MADADEKAAPQNTQDDTKEVRTDDTIDTTAGKTSLDDSAAKESTTNDSTAQEEKRKNRNAWLSEDEDTGGRRQGSRPIIAGLIAAVAIAAFLGGYTIGTGGDSATDESISEILGILREARMQQAAQHAAQQPPQAVPQGAPEPVFVSLDDDPLLGDPDAEITIVEFSDFQCPFCARFYHQTLPAIHSDFIETGRANLVYRDLPLEIHANAMPVHIASHCAHLQDEFWPYHDVLFEEQDIWGRLNQESLRAKLVEYAGDLGLDSSFEGCLESADAASEVRKDLAQARAYGANGTPTFFIGNDEIGYTKLVGAQPYEAFAAVINSQLTT